MKEKEYKERIVRKIGEALSEDVRNILTDQKNNVQESLELAYFQKIQVLTQQVNALQREVGVLTSERDELRYKLDKKTDPYQSKYLRMKEENKALKSELKRAEKTGCVVISNKKDILKKINSYESIISNLLNKVNKDLTI